MLAASFVLPSDIVPFLALRYILIRHKVIKFDVISPERPEKESLQQYLRCARIAEHYHTRAMEIAEAAIVKIQGLYQNPNSAK